MREHVISEGCLETIRRTCYEAGASGREVYTTRAPDGPEVVRCRDCAHFRPGSPSMNTPPRCTGVMAFVRPDPDGFCAWGKAEGCGRRGLRDGSDDGMSSEGVLSGLPLTIADPVDARAVEAIRRSVTGDNSQTLHSSLLVGCPFCGCATPFVQTWALGDLSWEARVVCGTCHVATSAECQSWRVRLEGGEDVTRLVAVGRAIASWNRRA